MPQFMMDCSCFHFRFVFLDQTGEILAAKLRANNAGSSNVSNHVGVFDAAIGQLPGATSQEIHCGDDPELVAQLVIARADGAGCTKGFLGAFRDRNVNFFFFAKSND